MKDDGRTEVITIRVTPAEKAAIREAAASGWDEPDSSIGEGRTLSRYLRVLALKNVQSKAGKVTKAKGRTVEQLKVAIGAELAKAKRRPKRWKK